MELSPSIGGIVIHTAKFLSIFIVLIAGLTACAPGVSNTEHKTPTSPDTQQTHVSTGALSTSTSEIAPSYEEISQHIFLITKRDERPEGPEVGLDGIVDPQIRAEVDNYSETLRGMKVQGWQGWLYNFAQSDVGNPDTGFNLNIYMKEPTSGTIAFNSVSLSDVDRVQVEKLEPSIDLHLIFGSWSEPLPRVVFSGTITGILDTGVVYITDALLAPAE
jgi:hypothetical protein